MSAKAHPVGLRLGIQREWASEWYANKREYARIVATEATNRAFIVNALRHFGGHVHPVDIRCVRTPGHTVYIIPVHWTKATKPVQERNLLHDVNRQRDTHWLEDGRTIEQTPMHGELNKMNNRLQSRLRNEERNLNAFSRRQKQGRMRSLFLSRLRLSLSQRKSQLLKPFTPLLNTLSAEDQKNRNISRLVAKWWTKKRDTERTRLAQKICSLVWTLQRESQRNSKGLIDRISKNRKYVSNKKK